MTVIQSLAPDLTSERVRQLFNPTSIVLVGATDKSSWSRAFYSNLVDSKFPGPVQLVNPRGGEVHGQKAYTSVGELPEPADLAIVMVPTGAVLGMMEEIADAGIRSAVILTSGGTGLTPDDLTVDAVQPHLTRELPGIAMAFWNKGLETIPTAVASRAVAGVNDTTFAMTLPGSTGGVKDGCAVLEDLIVHIVDMLEGKHEH